MDWKIVSPDPGLNYNLVILSGNPHLQMEKMYIIAAFQITARLQIGMLDDRVFSLKNLVQF